MGDRLFSRSTFVAQVIAFVVSASAHAAVFATALGPAPAPTREAGDVVAIDLDLEAPPAPEEQEPEPLPNRVSEGHDSPRVLPVPSQVAPREASRVRAVAVSAASPAVVAEAPNVLIADEAMPHFTIATSTGAPADGQLPGVSGTAPTAPVADDAPLSQQAVDTPARLLHGEVPSYPREARLDGIEADVALDIVLSKGGAIETVVVAGPAGHGLDEAAVAAAKKFRFSAASQRGRPVRVRVRWTVQFRLQ